MAGACARAGATSGGRRESAAEIACGAKSSWKRHAHSVITTPARSDAGSIARGPKRLAVRVFLGTSFFYVYVHIRLVLCSSYRKPPVLFTKWTRSPISVLMTIDDLPTIITIGTDAPDRHPQLTCCALSALSRQRRVCVCARLCVLGRHTSALSRPPSHPPQTSRKPCAASLRCSTPTSPLRRLRP